MNAHTEKSSLKTISVGVIALLLVLLPPSFTGDVLLIALWGMAFGGVPVAWKLEERLYRTIEVCVQWAFWSY